MLPPETGAGEDEGSLKERRQTPTYRERRERKRREGGAEETGT